jgi:carbonic anhydrase
MDARPARKLAIVTCMDARIDPLAAFGLELGDAHVLRNAGGMVTDDLLRSLAISQRSLGTTAVALVHHTSCGMSGFDDVEFRQTLTAESGVAPTWDVPGFTDVRAQVELSVEAIRACPWLLHRDDVRGYVFDTATGEVQATI